MSVCINSITDVCMDIGRAGDYRQEDSSERAHSTSPQQARGGGATEPGSLGLPIALPHSFIPLKHKIRWPVTSGTTPHLQI